jgi:hypothetical protein
MSLRPLSSSCAFAGSQTGRRNFEVQKKEEIMRETEREREREL